MQGRWGRWIAQDLFRRQNFRVWSRTVPGEREMKDGAQGGTRTLHGAREPKEQPSEAGEHLCEMLPSSDSTPPPHPGSPELSSLPSASCHPYVSLKHIAYVTVAGACHRCSDCLNMSPVSLAQKHICVDHLCDGYPNSPTGVPAMSLPSNYITWVVASSHAGPPSRVLCRHWSMSPAYLSPTQALGQAASIPDTYECHLNMLSEVTATVHSAPWEGLFLQSS